MFCTLMARMLANCNLLSTGTVAAAVEIQLGGARPGTKADNSVAQLTIKSAVLESCSVVSLSVLLALCRFVKEVHHPFCTTVCSLQIAFVHSGRALTSHLPCHGKPIKDLFQARTALLLQHLAECIQNPTRAPKVPLSIS